MDFRSVPTPTPPAPWREAVDTVTQALASTAVERDRAGGTAVRERDLLRSSGLLGLSVPRAYGGLGANWRATFDVVRGFARVDGSIAHLFAFHHLLLATARLFGQPSQWEPWFEQTIEHRWFWGNALNPLDKGTKAAPADSGGYVFTGRKTFCSGASDSDRLLASAFDAKGTLLVAVVPTARAGIRVLDDWDSIGQRQTDSGTVLFEDLAVAPDEVLANPGPLSTPFACLRPLLAQLILSNIYLGLGEGALAQARAFTLEHGRAWVASSAKAASDDPYVLAHVGDFWLALESARLLTDRAADMLDEAWRRGPELSARERGAVAVAVAASKVASARAGIDVANRLFEVTGPRATAGALRLDRFWRNLRVHTLHDPLDYKRRELGDWALNEAIPVPSFYS